MRKIFILMMMALPLLAGAQTTAPMGINVSEKQGTVDWPMVQSDNNLQFAYIYATQGAATQDGRFATNIDQARKTGLRVGAIHVYDRHQSAQDQFENFEAAVKGHAMDLVPVVQVIPDEPYNINIKRVDMLLQLLEKKHGKKPLICTTLEGYQKLFCLERYTAYHVMIITADLKFPASRYTLWQYTSREKIAGIMEYTPAFKLHLTYTEKDILLK